MTSRQSLLFCWMLLVPAAWMITTTDAFTLVPTKHSSRPTLRAASSNNNDENPLQGSELTSALARLDQQWSIQQRVAPNRSRWTKLMLPKQKDDDEKEDDDETSSSSPQDPVAQVKATAEAAASSLGEFVYLLEPTSAALPSCLIVFVGGAGLGQFPHIAYSECLTRLSDRLNAAVLAVPYQVGLDHFGLAKRCGDQLRRAILQCEDERGYPTNLPTYCLAHSLGCKLQTIYMAATQQEYEGMGFMSYNNFGLGQTVSMARTFAAQLQKEGTFNIPGSSEEVLNTIFDLAGNVLNMVGIEFSPSPIDMQRLVQMKYSEDMQQRTRLFTFDDDNLESTKEFVENCPGSGPTVSGLPGMHLTPVYFKLGLDDLPLEAREIAQEATGGFKSASFGDEEHLNQLVDEICNWILGKEPSRGPIWDSSVPQDGEPRRITGAASSKD